MRNIENYEETMSYLAEVMKMEKFDYETFKQCKDLFMKYRKSYLES